MMDDKKIPSIDDEFHFTEAEEMKGGDFNTPPEFDQKKSGKVNRRNVLIAIGIIVVALSLYKLIGVFLVSGEKKAPPVATTTVTTAVATQPQIQVQPQPIQVVSSLPNINNQVSSMHNNDAVVTKQQMAVITAQLSALNNTNQNLSAAIDNINQQLTALSSQMQTTQTALNALKPKVQPHHYNIVKVQAPPPPRWYIQAMVPGRAWLIQDNGQTTTVSQGDVLQGYGKVTYISVINGIVRTSSGVIIRFNNT